MTTTLSPPIRILGIVGILIASAIAVGRAANGNTGAAVTALVIGLALLAAAILVIRRGGSPPMPPPTPAGLPQPPPAPPDVY